MVCRATAFHTQGCPPVDLLVRTSGERRLSDFLLWQAGHAMLVYTPLLWPQFTFRELARILVRFQCARSSPDGVASSEVRGRMILHQSNHIRIDKAVILLHIAHSYKE